MGQARRHTGLSLVVVTLLLAGCTGGDDEAPTTTTASTDGATTTVEQTTTAAPATSSTVATAPADGDPCPAIAARAPQASDETIPVDFDGDGTPDTLRVYLAGSDWHVRGEIDGSGFHDQVVPTAGPSGVTPIFGARVNPDATEEAWVKIGSGASAAIVTLFVFRDCELLRPTLQGDPAELTLGASVRNASGVTCFMFDQGIEVFTTTSEDGVNHSGQSQLYTLDATSQPVPTLDPVEGWPMPVETTSPRTNLACGSKVYP